MDSARAGAETDPPRDDARTHRAAEPVTWPASAPAAQPTSQPAGTSTGARLTAILGAALRAAEATSGAVDPTLGHALEAIGDDRDVEQVQHRGGVTIGMVTAGRWRGIELDEQARTVLLPRGVRLDLGSIAKAWAADRCAAVVTDVLGVGVLVRLGGDIAIAGPPGSGRAGMCTTSSTRAAGCR